jgi:UDP-N-acetylmuramate dehydrogenase
MREGDVTLLLGAGDIIALQTLVKSWAEPPTRRIWIGAGTNTWRSDLETGEIYEKTSGRASIHGATLGIPWMAGIPGTVGGWIKMNAGAFGHSFSEVLRRVKVDGRWIDAADCGFGYRHSSIDGEIQDFELIDDLPKGDAAEYLSRRRKFPAGTKGSVFKNPPGDHAGRLLEAADCKGLRVGGAYVWEGHANVIVSEEGATASDFLALSQIMRARVLFRFGIALEPEVRGL